jgi:Ser/Thr protein kinase RdoA (MazF antagonist)
MTPAVKERLDDARLAEILSRYVLDSEHKLLSDWHAFTFEVQRGGIPFILRISDDSHRSVADIEGELEWIEFARKGGVSAPHVIPSRYGRTTEVIDASPSQFTAVLFEKLRGRSVADADWNAGLFKRWGALVGRLHRVSTVFRPSQHRAYWWESEFLNVDAYIPDDLPEIKRAAHELIEEIKFVPRDPFSFGLIHADVYQDNFFVLGNGLQLFDFDNCEYGFFASDVAIALYAALWRVPAEAERQDFSARFLEAFWAGYCTEYSLDGAQLEMLPLFLRLRDLLIYIVARKKLDLKNLTPIQTRLLAERGNRIAARIPIVDVGDRLSRGF